MGWVYYSRLVNTRFQAECLRARFEEAEGWIYRKVPQYIAIFETVNGKYGVKVLW